METRYRIKNPTRLSKFHTNESEAAVQTNLRQRTKKWYCIGSKKGGECTNYNCKFQSPSGNIVSEPIILFKQKRRQKVSSLSVLKKTDLIQNFHVY